MWSFHCHRTSRRWSGAKIGISHSDEGGQKVVSGCDLNNRKRLRKITCDGRETSAEIAIEQYRFRKCLRNRKKHHSSFVAAAVQVGCEKYIQSSSP